MESTSLTVAAALEHFQAGDLRQAEQIYRQIVQSDPNQADALQGLGGIAYRLGEYDQAIDWLQKARAIQGTNAALHSNLGAAYRATGRLAEAEACCRQALRLKPDFAEAYNNLGNILHLQGRIAEAVVCYQLAVLGRLNYAEAHSNLASALLDQGNLKEAVTSLQEAVRLRPEWAQGQLSLGAALRRLDQGKQAVSHLEEALRLEPDLPEAHYHLGRALEEQGDLDRAIPHFQQAHQLNRSRARKPAQPRIAPSGTAKLGPPAVPQTPHSPPEAAQAHHNLALALKREKKLDEAAWHCREALQLEPDFVEAQVTLGVSLARQGKLEEAVTAFHQALRIQPDHAGAAMRVGAALREQGHLERAVGYLRYALGLQPDLGEAHDQLGLALAEQGKSDDAVAALRQALRLQPDSVAALSHLGNLFEEMGQAEEAERFLKQALALDPEEPQVHVHYGTSLVNRGRFEEARAHFLTALALQPGFAPAFFALARDTRHVFTDAQVTQIQDLLNRDALLLRDQINLHFALARVLDQAQDFDNAFFHCDQGNACKKQLLQMQGNAFQPEAHAQFIERLMAAFNAGYFGRVRSFGSDSDLPVFIVGMPRSGTSLVEQILASHPAVYGAGEIRNLKQLVVELPAELGSSADYPECLDRLDSDAASRLADRYLQGLRHLGGNRLRVTDKVPMNFHHLGLIATLLPRAQIIHCRRDPRDVCWSCYFQNFREVPFACDLRTLGTYHRQYERLMGHWKGVLPLPILEICYEELVADVERVSREIVAFCKLPWHEACLNFHQTERLVRTSSNIQVRQPVHQKSVGYWKNYARHLGPLLEALNGAESSIDRSEGS